ncbi:MAG: M56 family metallopeptidase [Caldiserica bacterium]|nr:M56 family metallopeptidase [Caldisericota bacterium]
MKPLTRKHLSQRWQYYVWLLVVLRLLLPLAPTVTVPSGTLPSIFTRSAPSAATSVPTTTTPVDTVPGTSLPTGEPATSTETSPKTLPVTANGRTTWPASTLLLLIWAIGALAVMIWNIAGYTRFKRTVQRTMVRVTDAHFLAILEDCRQEVHVRATPRLYTSASVASPILLGILHPAIVLPDRQLTDNDLRYALLHELTHTRRQDGFLKWIAAIAVSIHWFNPLAYVMQYELNHSCELSCDETVTRQFSTDDRRGYGSMLLSVASTVGAPSPAMFSAMIEGKRNLKERLGIIMSSNKQTKRTPIVSIVAVVLVAVIGILAGCTPKVVPAEGPQISMMVETNFTSSEYDAGSLLLWNIGQNTLHISGTSVVHVSEIDYGGLPLFWQPGSPVRVVQQWGIPSKKALIATTSKEVNLLTPAEGMQYLSTKDGSIRRWYTSEGDAFVSVPLELDALPSETLDGKTLTITEQSISSGSKAKTLTAPVPSSLTQIVVVYGSGSTESGFVVVEASPANVPNNTPDSIWLLRINSGVGSWVDCGKLSVLFGGNIFSDQMPSFARVGPLLYFTHSFGKIGCIDTAAASPSITVPENINTLLAKLRESGPKNAEGPIQAQLANDNGTLIIEYPDANWNGLYYAVDASGTVLGNLHVEKTSTTSFDAKGKQGSSIPTPGSISFPSPDLFQ